MGHSMVCVRASVAAPRPRAGARAGAGWAGCDVSAGVGPAGGGAIDVRGAGAEEGTGAVGAGGGGAVGGAAGADGVAGPGIRGNGEGTSNKGVG